MLLMIWKKKNQLVVNRVAASNAGLALQADRRGGPAVDFCEESPIMT